MITAMRFFMYANKKYKTLGDNIYKSLLSNDLKIKEECNDDNIEELLKEMIYTTIYELDRLKRSKISIKDYEQYIKTIENAKKTLQPYCSTSIKLDRLPMHPSEIYHDSLYIITNYYEIEEKLLRQAFERIYSNIFCSTYKLKITNRVKNKYKRFSLFIKFLSKLLRK